MNKIKIVKKDELEEEEKWKFCEDKVCDSCKMTIEYYYKDYKGIVTGCPYCNRSFVD